MEDVGVVIVIALALGFDYTNGFHDAANSIATVVSTRVLSPNLAVAWAAFFNFVAAFAGNLKVANTMGKGIIDFEMLRAQGSTAVLLVIFSALMGAILWNLLTWWWGLPSSSSHALAALFENGHDPIFIIKWKDIYQELESATDRCEDVANVIEGVVLEHS